MSFPLTKKFNPENCHITLSIERPTIPAFIHDAAKKLGLIEKQEFHISVAVTKNARRIKEVMRANKSPDAMQKEIVSLVNGFSWEYALTDEYLLQEHSYTKEDLVENGYTDLTEHTRRSIVQRVTLPDLKLFYGKLNTLLKISITVPPPHITLFTWSDYEPMKLRGIGIASEEEFRRYTKERLSPIP